MEHRVVYIDSRDREYDVHPTPTSYRVTLPRSYYNVVEARLLSMELPNSFYVFSSAHANTTLRVSLGGAPTDLQIPDGNYTDVSMAAALMLGLEDAYPGETFDVTIDPTTLRLILECTSSPTATLEVDTTVHCTASKPTDWGLGYYLGFVALATEAGTGSVTSPGVVNVNPWTYILMDVQELNTSDEIGSLGTFHKIPLDSNSFGYSFYNAVAQGTPAVRQSPPVHRLRTLTVSFRFHDGTPVDFHGVEHSFALVLGCAPRSSEFGVPAAAALALPASTEKDAAPPLPPRPHARHARQHLPDTPQGASKKTVVGGVVLAVLVAGGVWYLVRRQPVSM